MASERESYEQKIREMREREELVGLVHESFEERLRGSKLEHLRELAMAKSEARQATASVVEVAQSRLAAAVADFHSRKQVEVRA